MTLIIRLFSFILCISQCHGIETQERQPIILLSWDSIEPTISSERVLKKIESLGAIPFKWDYKDSDIDVIALEKEVTTIAALITAGKCDSIAKKILDFATQDSFPEISKIKLKAHSWVALADGVLIPGGIFVHSIFYGQECRYKGPYDFRRDLFEFAILDEWEKNDIPLLAICRGLQLVNVWRGGTLNQHVDGHRYKVQQYRLADPNVYSLTQKLFSIPEKPFTGYSVHHQTVDRVGKGLIVTALSDDQIIKAMELQNKIFALLVQWHPEYKGDLSTPEAIALDAKLSPGNHFLFEEFIAATRHL
jgi:putative glutamine amidotransferase